MPEKDDFDPNTAPGDGAPFDATVAATHAMGAGESEGLIIGRYHLLQKIGEGGMGEVWLAEQKQPVRRRVALKLVKAGMNTREVIARFESERQALALMDHPAIARVLDAGSAPDGSPYFVMEYVAGVPITEYCDNHKLNTRERLELFVHVCEGVQHAHQKAIIHRDLKPSNILVTSVDGRAVPKIIDFGVAKALTQRLTDDTMFTRVGAMIGTPEYMSPEQADSSGEDIDTRTDVYSLGVVFYELLVGVPPLELKKLSLQQLLTRLRDDDAPKPSTKIRTLDDQWTDLANKRRTEPLALSKQVRGDLDAIALKALEKDRSRRYGSPSDFSADICRYLNNEPVLAVAPSAAYRARKFASRYRGALVTFCAFVLVLVLAAGISVWQSIRATAQRNRADSEAAISKAVTQFLQNDLLSQASPEAQNTGSAKIDPDVRVRTLLDRAAGNVGKRFANAPLVESQIRKTIGEAYVDLGLKEQAEPQMRRAYELSRDHRGAADIETIEILKVLSYIVGDLGRDAEGLDLKKQVLDLETRTLGPDDPRTAVAMQSLGVSYLFTGQHALAEPLLQKALALQVRRAGYDNAETLDTSDSLATVYLAQGRYVEADALLTKGLQSYIRMYGPEHPNTGRERFGLARVLIAEGKYSEAAKLLTEILAISKRVNGPLHPDTLTITGRLGQAYAYDGKFDLAIPLLEESVQDFHQIVSPTNPRLLSVQQWLASAYGAQGDLPRAEQLFRLILAGFQKQGSGSDSSAAETAALLGANLIRQGKNAEAEPVLREAHAFFEKSGQNGWQSFRVRALLGAALAAETKYAEAEPLLVSGYQGLQQRRDNLPAEQKKWIPFAGERIVALYTAWSKPDEAAKWRAKLK